MVNDFSRVDEFRHRDRTVHRNQSGTFINTEWRACRGGSIPDRGLTLTQFPPWMTPESASSLSSIAKALWCKMCVNWLWRANAEYYLWRHWTSSKNQHPSLCCLGYQFSIMVKLKLSRFPVKHFASLIMWLFCDLSENIHVFCLT